MGGTSALSSICDVNLSFHIFHAPRVWPEWGGSNSQPTGLHPDKCLLGFSMCMDCPFPVLSPFWHWDYGERGWIQTIEAQRTTCALKFKGGDLQSPALVACLLSHKEAPHCCGAKKTGCLRCPHMRGSANPPSLRYSLQPPFASYWTFNRSCSYSRHLFC